MFVDLYDVLHPKSAFNNLLTEHTWIHRAS